MAETPPESSDFKKVDPILDRPQVGRVSPVFAQFAKEAIIDALRGAAEFGDPYMEVVTSTVSGQILHGYSLSEDKQAWDLLRGRNSRGYEYFVLESRQRHPITIVRRNLIRPLGYQQEIEKYGLIYEPDGSDDTPGNFLAGHYCAEILPVLDWSGLSGNNYGVPERAEMHNRATASLTVKFDDGHLAFMSRALFTGFRRLLPPL